MRKQIERGNYWQQLAHTCEYATNKKDQRGMNTDGTKRN